MEKALKTRILLLGFGGGLAGNLTMQLFGAVIFALLSMPLSTSFKIIGDAAGAFFTSLGMPLPGGAWMGALWNNLIGLILGGAWALAVIRWDSLRTCAFRKWILLSIAYVEAMSIPMLAAGILALKLDLADSALWIGISIVMHLVYGLVLGLALRHELSILSETGTPPTEQILEEVIDLTSARGRGTAK